MDIVRRNLVLVTIAMKKTKEWTEMNTKINYVLTLITSPYPSRNSCKGNSVEGMHVHTR